MAATQKLVFVVGAGASHEVNLPVGNQLTGDIARALDFKTSTADDNIAQAIGLQIKSDGNPYRDPWAACRRIVGAVRQAESIDSFIHENRADPAIEFCGKLAICACIVKAERNSSLFVPADKQESHEFADEAKVANSWFPSFANLIKRGRQKGELADRLAAITLIVFNYDRCIEHFLFHWLARYYALTAQEAGDLVRPIRILRPYGSVGPVGGGYGFGQELVLSRLIEATHGIKTFSEAASSDEMAEIHSAIVEADKLIFLGFAFHKQNVDLLTPSLNDRKARGTDVLRKQIFATAKDVHEYERQRHVSRMSGLYNCKQSGTPLKHGEPIIDDMTCLQLFERYKGGFSFE